MNDDLDFMIIMAQSSAVEVPSIRAWARKDCGVQSFVTLLSESETGAVPGVDCPARYGDYFDLHLDPADTTRFWGAGELWLLTGGGEAEWGTRLMHLDDVPP